MAERAGHYLYVSSGSVDRPPLAVGLDERAPTVAGSSDDVLGAAAPGLAPSKECAALAARVRSSGG